MLATAGEIEAVRENAVSLLELFDYMLRQEANFPDTERIRVILRDKRLVKPLWRAATARILTPRYVGGLDTTRQHIAALGVTLPVPRWWNPTLKGLGLPKPIATPLPVPSP